MGNTVYNIHAKASLPCVHLPVIAIAGKGGTYWPDDVPEAIRKSCVLWYDPARQGCTNESMATNPVLKDLSGNGHYARCYNFAWSGMSGIGGYVQSNFNIRPNDSTIYGVSVSDNIVTYQTANGSVMDANNLALFDAGANWNKDVETKVKAGKYGLNVYVSEGRGVNPKNILSLPPYDIGSFTYAQSDYDDGKVYIMFGNTIEVPVGEANSFEFLPLYPNALVSDGVDDYAAVEGLPLLNKERGFTVLAKRKWISDINSKSQGFATKGTSLAWIDGAFYFECVEGNGSAPFNRVFDNSNGQRGVNYISNFTENDITYLTSKEYNGSPLNNIGDAVDTDGLQLFKLVFNDTTNLSSIALYSFILFNRDLTNEEIEWVKTNLIGGENQ